MSKFDLGHEMLRLQLESTENWRGFCPSLPYFSFPPEWEVRTLPPFGGALLRFSVRKRGGGKEISVYFDVFDVFDALGFADQQQYWEIYPDSYGDLQRFLTHELKEMFEEINKSLEMV